MKNFVGVVGMALCAWVVSFSTAQAQQCATDEHFHHWAEEHPQEAAEYYDQLANLNNRIAQGDNRRDGEDVRIIPTVIHVFHDGCVGKIGMAQINDAMDVLNTDFRRTNPDAGSTREVFQSVAADTKFEFRLARKDPNGNPTTGVVYIDTPETNNAGDNIKSLSRWPSDQYMNIWVVESIQSFGGGGGIINGYAQFPGGGNWGTYGVVIRNPVFGRIGTSNADGRTFTHELGHCFGLFHTFQGGCGGDCASSGDFVCDTPPVSNSTWSCNDNQNTCNNDALGSDAFNNNVVDQIENYMSYDDCQNMFTQGQKERMDETVNNFTRLVNLMSEENLQATGVYELSTANFRADRAPVVLMGDMLQLKDATEYGATGWDWEIGGTWPNNTSTEKDPVAFFTSPGLQDVTLTATNDVSERIRTKPGYILVGTQIGRPLPITEGFEDAAYPNDNWYLHNPDEDIYLWNISDVTAATGNQSLRMVNHGSCDGFSDELISTSLDLSPYSSVNLSFKTAYRRKSPVDTDVLRISISNDGGRTWIPRWVETGANLAGNQVQNTPYTAQPGDWVTQSRTLSTALELREGILMKWEFESGGGNNLYLDDIELTGIYKPVPVLESPRDNAADQDATTLLNWKAVGNVDSYEYQLDLINTFNSNELQTGTLAYIDESPLNGDTEFEASGLFSGSTYYWRVRAITNGTPSDWSDTWTFTVAANGVGISDLTDQVTEFKVFPNPATDQTQVAFNVEQRGPVTVDLMDLTGRTIEQIASANLLEGPYNYAIATENLTTGIYLVRLTINGQSAMKKLIVN